MSTFQFELCWKLCATILIMQLFTILIAKVCNLQGPQGHRVCFLQPFKVIGVGEVNFNPSGCEKCIG